MKVKTLCKALGLSLALATSSIAMMPSAYATDKPITVESEYAKTQYPIVLMPGLFGFDNVAGIVIHWVGMVEEIERNGGTAHVTQPNVFGSFMRRGETTIEQLEALKATYGYEKFNLVGHSQGGFDARYVAGTRPDLVASVTTLASPHDPETITSAPAFIKDSEATLFFLDIFGKLIALLSHNNYPVATVEPYQGFTTENMREYNKLFPAGLPSVYCGEGNHVEIVDGHEIKFFSWSGNKAITNWLDPGEFLHAILEKTVPLPNDGFVNQCGSHFGKVIRDDYKLNHLDQGNLFFGLTNPWEATPEALIRVHANRLKKAGL